MTKRILLIQGQGSKPITSFRGVSSTAGIALIEFIAVAAPVALIIFFLIADFGRVMRLADELAFSARAGVEYGYQHWIFGDPLNDTVLRANMGSATRCAIKNSLDQCKYISAAVVVNKVCDCPSGSTMNPPGSLCTDIDVLGSGVRCTGYGLPQIEYTVTISTSFSPATPLISSIVGDRIVITRSASHRVQ